jgi:hypothetical protein
LALAICRHSDCGKWHSALEEKNIRVYVLRWRKAGDIAGDLRNVDLSGSSEAEAAHLSERNTSVPVSDGLLISDVRHEATYLAGA